MIEITIDLQTYNLEKLDAELRVIPSFDGLIDSDTLTAILFDGATQQDIDAVLSIASSHDPSPSTDQQNETSRKQLASDLKSAYLPFIAIAQLIQTAYEDAILANETIDVTYQRYRTIYAGLTAQQQNIIRRHARQYNVDVNDPLLRVPPIALIDDYRRDFNAIMLSFKTNVLVATLQQ